MSVCVVCFCTFSQSKKHFGKYVEELDKKMNINFKSMVNMKLPPVILAKKNMKRGEKEASLEENRLSYRPKK